MYKLSSFTYQKLQQLVAQQKEKLLGAENYQRFGTLFPLHVKFYRDNIPHSLTPGEGSLCYIHRPLLGTGFLMAEIRSSKSSPLTPLTIDYSELDSFVLFIGLNGSCQLTDDSGHTVTLREGETVLLPATTHNVKVEGTIKFLETYI
jgi:mannose-6-phosphate isomerase class I